MKYKCLLASHIDVLPYDATPEGIDAPVKSKDHRNTQYAIHNTDITDYWYMVILCDDIMNYDMSNHFFDENSNPIAAAAIVTSTIFIHEAMPDSNIVVRDTDWEYCEGAAPSWP